MTALEIFRLIAKEFSGMTDNEVLEYIALAELDISEGIYGALYEKALVYSAAHTIKLNELMSGGLASVFAVKSEKEGDLQRTYAVSDTKTCNPLASTIYGQELLNMQRLCVVPILTR